jgi:threonylcarbamoyladenosine tRNA methylthiotransferase MtaB
VRVFYHTFGCKANQYDTERMRQELAARGATTTARIADADLCVLNTCTVTNNADAEARRMVRRVRRLRPDARIVVAGCSAALHAPDFEAMDGVTAVVPGHDPVRVAEASAPATLVKLDDRRGLDRLDVEPVGGELLRRRSAGTRGWLKIQDGCDRKCAFCATRLARGASRSRPPGAVVSEARLLARHHPEIVLTGIHIGHYGHDLDDPGTLGALVNRLLDEVPDVRFRLGSVEATEICDELVDRLCDSGGRLAPHLHMPLQSGADPVLRRMRRWHTRDQYRRRTLEIAERLPVLGLGADIITGFPGETESDHRATAELVEELPFTYLHVFPFSPRDDTVAARLVREMPVPERVAGERSRELRDLVREKARTYESGRSGGAAQVVVEREGSGLTGDYLRVAIPGAPARRVGHLACGVLQMGPDGLYIEGLGPDGASPRT